MGLNRMRARSNSDPLAQQRLAARPSASGPMASWAEILGHSYRGKELLTT